MTPEVALSRFAAAALGDPLILLLVCSCSSFWYSSADLLGVLGERIAGTGCIAEVAESVAATTGVAAAAAAVVLDLLVLMLGKLTGGLYIAAAAAAFVSMCCGDSSWMQLLLPPSSAATAAARLFECWLTLAESTRPSVCCIVDSTVVTGAGTTGTTVGASAVKPWGFLRDQGRKAAACMQCKVSMF